MEIYRQGEQPPPKPSRIWATFFYAAGALSVTPLFLASIIESIIDHKGEIRIVWTIRPPDAWREAFNRGWAICANENAESVVHLEPHETVNTPDHGGMVD